VQDAHISKQLPALHAALMSIVSAVNRPQRDEALIKRAGISLDRALFPLMVVIQKLGPIGVVDLAERVGRDYTTVSRQVTKLASLELVERRASAADGRVTEASVTPKGRAMTDLVDRAREKFAQEVFRSWEPEEFDQLVRLMGKFAQAVEAAP
jgi:DNA-binding MarR family transcriptional regulator